jgi:putative methionine-R-sulfoxide reductase with GAF domain
MGAADDSLIADLRNVVSMDGDRAERLKLLADLLRERGGHRWVGLYDVDGPSGLVRNIVWSGPGAPEYPTFPITSGLTGAAIAGRKTVNVGDVSADVRYLTAFGSTRSEIIVPVFDESGSVTGTIDIESEKTNAFDAETQALLEACGAVIRPLWRA